MQLAFWNALTSFGKVIVILLVIVFVSLVSLILIPPKQVGIPAQFIEENMVGDETFKPFSIEEVYKLNSFENVSLQGVIINLVKMVKSTGLMESSGFVMFFTNLPDKFSVGDFVMINGTFIWGRTHGLGGVNVTHAKLLDSNFTISPPLTVDPSFIKFDNYGYYVKIENATVHEIINDTSDPTGLYYDFGFFAWSDLGNFEVGKAYDITGYVSYYFKPMLWIVDAIEK